MALPPERPFELAEDMLDAIVAAYDTAGVDLPDRQYVSAGPAVDDCPMLAVWLTQNTPSLLDPALDVLDSISPSGAFASQSGTYVIRLMRCQGAVPRVKSRRIVIPSVTAEQGDAEVVMADMIRVHNALVDAVKGSPAIVACNSFVFINAVVVGPSGGHVGSDTTVKVGLTSG
jgi:hypothetical protein